MAQVCQSTSVEVSARRPSLQFTHRLGFNAPLRSLRLRPGPLPTAIAVAAPERNVPTAAEPPILLANSQRDEIAELASMLSASENIRQQSVDDPSLAPSTSGRPPHASDVHNAHDRPFLSGSRRRPRNPTSRRSLSTATFYGEYCDLKATQQMVSKVWERLMVGDPSTEGRQEQADAVAAVVQNPQRTAAAADLVPRPPGAAATRPVLPPGTQEHHHHTQSDGGGNSSVAAAAVATPTDGATDHKALLQHAPTVAAAAGGVPSPGAVSPPVQGLSCTATGTPPSGLAAGWSVSPAHAVSGRGHGGTAASSAAPYKRVVLYLGPEFELELPPGPSGDLAATWPMGAADDGSDAIGGGEYPGPSWSLSEQEFRASISAPKPRRVRARALSKPEVVREVSFGAGGGGAPAGAKRSRGRPRGTGGRSEGKRVTAATAMDEQLSEGGLTWSESGHRSTDARQAGAGSEVDQQQQQQLLLLQRGSGEQQARGKGGRSRSWTAGEVTEAEAEEATDVGAAPVHGVAAAGEPREKERGFQGQGQQQAGSPLAHSEVRQMARKRDLLQALVERSGDEVVTEMIRQVAAVNRTGITAINYVIQTLGEMGHVHALSRLLTLQVALGLYNEHTYATAFRALHRAGRLEMALAAFQEACRSGRDLGPVACCVLLHITSLERNIKLAWQLFDEMMVHEMTLNRFGYNCMAHVASMYGSLDDVRLVYSMMKTEAAGGGRGGRPRPDCLPDSYTYSAMVRAALNGGRGDLLPALFNEMVAAQRAQDRATGRPRPLAPGAGDGRVSAEVWGHFMSAAARTGQHDLGLRFFEAGLRELGLLPTKEIYNILLAGLARTRPLSELMLLYNEMVQGRLWPAPTNATTATTTDQLASVAAAPPPPLSPPPGTVLQPPMVPDHYTFNALVTAAAHQMADTATLERIRGEMNRHGVALNTFVGTSLINAYRRTPEVRAAAEAAGGGDAAAAAAAAAAVERAVSAAAAILDELVSSGDFSPMTYMCMAALYATAQRPTEVKACVRQMMARDLLADDTAWAFLLTAVQDAGQFGLVAPLTAARRLQQEQRQEQRHAQRHNHHNRHRNHHNHQQVQRQATAAAAAAPPPPPPLPHDTPPSHQRQPPQHSAPPHRAALANGRDRGQQHKQPGEEGCQQRQPLFFGDLAEEGLFFPGPEERGAQVRDRSRGQALAPRPSRHAPGE